MAIQEAVCWWSLEGASSNEGEEMENIPEVVWGRKQYKLLKSLCSICGCTAACGLPHFRSGPQREIDGTNLAASPDARAEIPTVTAEAARLCRSSFLKKVRPCMCILRCC